MCSFTLTLLFFAPHRLHLHPCHLALFFFFNPFFALSTVHVTDTFELEELFRQRSFGWWP